MDPSTYAAIAVGSQIVGGLIGNFAGSADRARMQDLINQSYNELEKLGLPPNLSGPLILEQFKVAGVYTPTLEKDLGDIHSQWETYEENKQYANITKDAINQLKQRSQGRTPASAIATNDILENLNTAKRAQEQRILNDFRERRMGGSGAEIQSLLGSGQQDVNQSYRNALQLAANEDQTRLQSIISAADLASRYGQAEYEKAAQKMDRMDALARFNAQNQRNLQSTNVGLLNQAQLQRLQTEQDVSNRNVDTAIRERQRQSMEEGNFFDRNLSLANAKNAARAGQAQAYGQNAQRTEQMWGNIGQGVGNLIGSYGQYDLQKDALEAQKQLSTSQKNLLDAQAGYYNRGGQPISTPNVGSTWSDFKLQSGYGNPYQPEKKSMYGAFNPNKFNMFGN